ncbi:uncharacterized protein LOC112453189 isoform X2 [Temnothorax curvispinosus]|nr:uncharacterized protein LOC112453189 isoform X2 [Temnothorax curvispinosus]
MISKATMTSKKKDSPTKKRLCKTIEKMRLKNKDLQQKLRRLRKKVEKSITTKESPHGEDKVQKNKELETLRTLGNKWLPDKFSMLLSVQVDAQTRDKRGIRYNNDFKKFALSMYFLSPRNYKELRKIFTLPSVRTLQSFTYNWNILPGLNIKVFEALKIKLNSLSLIERHCVLCIDEMSLKSHLFYDVSRDEIIGFQDVGDNKLPISAKNAFVIMARSIAGNWKVPLCYCFVATTCTSDTIKTIIFDAIRKLKECGATVHALITDMGSNFLQLSRELGISTKNSMFVVDEQNILYIFDTPHLIKATRNNLLKYNLKFNDKFCIMVLYCSILFKRY